MRPAPEVPPKAADSQHRLPDRQGQWSRQDSPCREARTGPWTRRLRTPADAASIRCEGAAGGPGVARPRAFCEWPRARLLDPRTPGQAPRAPSSFSTRSSDRGHTDSCERSDHCALSSRTRPLGASLSPWCPRTGGGGELELLCRGEALPHFSWLPCLDWALGGPSYPQRACAEILGACVPEAWSQAVFAGLYSSALLVVATARNWVAGTTRADSLPVLKARRPWSRCGQHWFVLRPLSWREDRHPLPVSSCACPSALVWPHRLLSWGHWSFGTRAHASDLGCLSHHIDVLISDYSDALSSGAGPSTQEFEGHS